MSSVGSHRSARTIGLALVAGFIALEAFLALRTGALGIPGIFLVRFANESGGDRATQATEKPEAGESVIAKSSEGTAAPKPAPEQATGSVSTGSGEKRLEGLSEIPLKPWDRDDEEESAAEEPKAEPGASQAREELPWDAVEPVPFDSAAPAPSQARSAAPQTPPPGPLAALPAGSEVAAWVKAKATTVKGHDRARPFYHFEFWLEPPQEVTQRLASVAYEFNTPAVMPQSQVSREEKTGFRVSAGGLVCADKVTVTLRFKDGRSQRVEVDGCKLLS